MANVNDELAERGVQTWFDEEVGMSHDIDSCMAEGIEECDVFVVFVTCATVKRSNGLHATRARATTTAEFSYAQCLNKLMLPVVSNRTCWTSGHEIVKMNCANKMYVDDRFRFRRRSQGDYEAETTLQAFESTTPRFSRLSPSSEHESKFARIRRA